VDVGYNFLSPVNWCPADNEDLPCPAPLGAVVPWQSNPPELALPGARQGAIAIQSGSHLYLAGGAAADGTVLAETLETTVTTDGNFQPWIAGPALPEPRTDAAYASLSGVPYVIGGLDAAGAPTSTVYMGQLEEGALTGWVLADGQEGRPDLTLPVPVAGAAAAGSGNAIYLMGGRTADGLTASVWRSALPANSPVLGPWEEVEGAPLPEPRADASAASIGNQIYVAGGEGPRGVSSAVSTLFLEAGLPRIDEVTGEPEGWVTDPDQALPAPRARASTFSANGLLYVVGGVDDTASLQYTTLWAIPDATGAVTWHYLDQSNLTDGIADAASVAVGATAFLFGGETEDGVSDGASRANLSPAPPFFRLGLFGATLPALSIKGEIGQQLGYINAMTVGMINFVVLVAIGLAFSHRTQTFRLIERLTRGRFRAPRDDEYTPTV
jgi:N-acetylneuraminic acid mutarotase